MDFDQYNPPSNIKDYLREECNYDSVEIIMDYDRPIYVFNNFIINEGAEEKIYLPGTWNVMTEGGMNYGHMVKESLGSFLYLQNIFPEAKILFMNVCGRKVHEERQNTLGVLKYINDRLLNDFGPNSYTLDGRALYTYEIKIDKFIIMMDNGGLFFSKGKAAFNDVVAPYICKILIEYLNEFKKDNPDSPKKIYITRKAVSKELKEKNMHTLPYYKTRYFEEWVEDPIEQCFSDNGYQIVDVNGMSLGDQISLFHNATHVAGILGCAFMNTMFMQNGAHIYAVRPNNLHWAEWEEDINTLLPDTIYDNIDPWDCKNSAEIYDYIKERICL